MTPLVLLAATACGAVTQPVHAAPTVAAVVGTGLLPETDTPVAAAPQKLADAWAPVDVDVIHSRHVYDTVPHTAPVAVVQVAGMSADEGARVVQALLREGAMIGWADAHHELGLRARVDATATSVGPVADALGAGATVQHPACDLFPTSVTLVALDGDTRSFFDHLNQPPGAGDITALLGYAGPCTTTATYPGDRHATVSTFTSSEVIEVGRVVDDPLLGGIFHADGVAACGTAGAPAPLCEPAS